MTTEDKPNIDETEPAVLRGSLTALLTAVLALLVAWGVDISPDRQTAILGVLAAAGPLVSGWLIRCTVWSPASHRAALDVAKTRRRP